MNQQLILLSRCSINICSKMGQSQEERFRSACESRAIVASAGYRAYIWSQDFGCEELRPESCSRPKFCESPGNSIVLGTLNQYLLLWEYALSSVWLRLGSSLSLFTLENTPLGVKVKGTELRGPFWSCWLKTMWSVRRLRVSVPSALRPHSLRGYNPCDRWEVARDMRQALVKRGTVGPAHWGEAGNSRCTRQHATGYAFT